MGRGGASEDLTSIMVSTSPQQDYLDGLQNLRGLVADIASDVVVGRKQFCQAAQEEFREQALQDGVLTPTQQEEEERYERYLQACNDKLLHCNRKLRRNNQSLHVIDSEVRLVEVLNKLRELPSEEIDPETISFLTDFWERLKNCMESLHAVAGRFRVTVLKRLQMGCVNHQPDGHKPLDLTRRYGENAQRLETHIEEYLYKADLLRKSFSNGMRQDLFTKSDFSHRILITCDNKAFPILRIYPDLSEKLIHVCDLAKEWIDKDEVYVNNINKHILETRHRTRMRQADLRTQKHHQSELSQSVKDACNLFKSNKAKLARMESDLTALEQQMAQYTTEKRYKTEEFKQKEGIVGFLEISISQTKHNSTLQLKRSRMLRQLRELEQELAQIANELTTLQGQLSTKSNELVRSQARVSETHSRYEDLQTQLDKLNANLKGLHLEIVNLSGSVEQLEAIQTFKTCPEVVEDFYERPSTVKLAPSLRDKIMERKKRLQQQQGPK